MFRALCTAMALTLATPALAQKGPPYFIANSTNPWPKDGTGKMCMEQSTYVFLNVFKMSNFRVTGSRVFASIGPYSFSMFCMEPLRIYILTVAGPDSETTDKLMNGLGDKLFGK